MFERAQRDDDPRRCQANSRGEQCRNLGLKEGDIYFEYCLAHGGNRQRDKLKQEGLRNYRLTKWQARVEQFGREPEIKSLRDEIGILRLLMEERLNRCGDAQDLILQSAPISDLVMKIEKVVASCHKLEGSMGQLLDKQAILQFAQQVIGIVGTALAGQEDKIDEIATGIIDLVAEDHGS